MLTGTLKTPEDAKAKQMFPRFQGENFQKNLELVKEVEKLAQKYHVTPSQLCLAWVLRKLIILSKFDIMYRSKSLDYSNSWNNKG